MYGHVDDVFNYYLAIPTPYTWSKNMRNTIQVVDKNIPQITVGRLEAGVMFRYPKGANDQNVYMKTDTGSVVQLSTGTHYKDFNVDALIEVIDAIRITR